MTSTRTRQFARVVSIVLHPFLVAPLVVAVVLLRRLDARDALLYAGIVAAVGVLPIWLYIARNVRRGDWTDVDVSVRAQRPRLYLMGVLIALLCTAVSALAGAPRLVIVGAADVSAMLLTGSLVNRWIKLSLHSAFGAWATAVVLQVDVLAGAVALCALALLAWSRVYLRRHTPAEVACGLALGAAFGFALMFL